MRTGASGKGISRGVLFQKIGSMLGAGLGLYTLVWMVLIVRPNVPGPSSQTLAQNTDFSEKSSPAVMPNRTERELTKLCLARSHAGKPSDRSPAASWQGTWNGKLGDVISAGGLNMDWRCHVVETSPANGLLCSTRPHSKKTFRILPLHHLGTQTEWVKVGDVVELQHVRHGLVEKAGVVVTVETTCDVQVIVDSERFIKVLPQEAHHIQSPARNPPQALPKGPAPIHPHDPIP